MVFCSSSREEEVGEGTRSLSLRVLAAGFLICFHLHFITSETPFFPSPPGILMMASWNDLVGLGENYFHVVLR